MTIQDELITTIADLVQPGKGILAADESTAALFSPRPALANTSAA